MRIYISLYWCWPGTLFIIICYCEYRYMLIIVRGLTCFFIEIFCQIAKHVRLFMFNVTYEWIKRAFTITTIMKDNDITLNKLLAKSSSYCIFIIFMINSERGICWLLYVYTSSALQTTFSFGCIQFISWAT